MRIINLKRGENDYVIICGDFGIGDDSKQERYWMDWLNDKSFTTLFVTGNHSNYDLLEQYPINEWNVALFREFETP